MLMWAGKAPVVANISDRGEGLWLGGVPTRRRRNAHYERSPVSPPQPRAGEGRARAEEGSGRGGRGRHGEGAEPSWTLRPAS